MELLDAAAERGVGVEDLVADPQERADPRHLGLALVLRPRLAGLRELGLVPEEHQHRRHPVIERGVEVVVEVAAVRRVPRELPSHPLAVGSQRRVRRPGDGHERGVADVQLAQPRELVGRRGAAGARLVPVRAVHEVVHHQLRPAVEQVGQPDLSVRAFEPVVLLDADHRQPTAVGVHPRAQVGQLLLLRQQLSARREPLLPRDHFGQISDRRHGRSVPAATMDT